MRSIFWMAILASLLVIAGCSQSPETPGTLNKAPKQDEGSRTPARDAEEDKAGLGDAAAGSERIQQARRSRQARESRRPQWSSRKNRLPQPLVSPS
ncbi:MAG: hypothetical protein V3S64_01640, partial [bacterium]